MTTFHVDDIQSELYWLDQRISRNIAEFASLMDRCPVTAMSLMDTVAADRTRHFRLSMLLHALNHGWESWVGQSIDERMQAENFQRVSLYQLLYIRHQPEPDAGVDLCDLFDIIHIEPQAVKDLIRVLRRK